MASINGNLPNIPGGGAIPPRIQTTNLAPPPLPPSVEQFTSSGTPQPPVSVSSSAPVTKVYDNGVQVTRFSAQGAEIGMKAVLPAIPGGGQFLPLNVSLEIRKDNAGRVTGTRAYLSDAQGQALTDSQGKARELPTYQLDGRFLVPTDPKNPGTSPYIMIEPELGGGVAYGLAEGVKYQGDPQQGYQIARSELMDSDNNRVMRFQEQAGPLKENDGLTGGFGLMKKLGSLVGSAPDLGRSLQYEQVMVNPQGGTHAANIQYDHIKPGERPFGAYTKHAKYLITNKVTSRFEGNRPMAGSVDGDMQLGPASKSLMTGGVFRKFPQNTVNVRSMNADYSTPQAQARILQTLTGGETVSQPATQPASQPAANQQAQLEGAIQDKFDRDFNPQVATLFQAPDSPHAEALKAAQLAASDAVNSGADPSAAYVSSLTNYAASQVKVFEEASKGGNPLVLSALSGPKNALTAFVNSGTQLLGLINQRPQDDAPVVVATSAAAAPTQAQAATSAATPILDPAKAQQLMQHSQQALGQANQALLESTAYAGVAADLRQAKEQMIQGGMTAAQARQNIGNAMRQNGANLTRDSQNAAREYIMKALTGAIGDVKKEAAAKGLTIAEPEANLVAQMRLHTTNLNATATNNKLSEMMGPDAGIPGIGELLHKNLDETGHLRAGTFAQELGSIINLQQPAVIKRIEDLQAQAQKSTNPDEKEKLMNQMEDLDAHFRGYQDAYTGAVILDSARSSLVAKELIDTQGVSADPKSLAVLDTGKIA